jgi:glycosyltransferase involved in cell wall biosynthesis
VPDVPAIAYLTNVYARASDSFIRGEVAQLRDLGHTVHTFSIRKSPESEVVSDEVRRERASTVYVVTRDNLLRLFVSAVREMLGSPARFAEALRLALLCSLPGIRGKVWALAYLVEACFLAREFRRLSVGHLHNHIGEGVGVVAMLAALLAGIRYSLTIHGPGEFDQAPFMALDEKVGRSAFVVTVSFFGRSQLMRWTRPGNWPKVKLVRCGVGPDFMKQPATPCPDEPHFVWVGRLAPEKGVVTLVQAVQAVAREHPIRMAIVGDGPLRPLVEDTVRCSGLDGRVTIVGWADAPRVREEILKARAFVLPSYAENLPGVIMEAWLRAGRL